MSCLSPMLRVPTGYDRWSLEKDGVLKERALILVDMPSQRQKLDDCNIPYDIIPCGHCPECFTKRVRDWSIRLLQESYYHKENYFLTLTIDDRHMRKSRSLCKKDVQKFIKRLRNYIAKYVDGEYKIKYYAVGEYGDAKGDRCGLNPHYHVVLYGCPLSVIGGLSYIFPDGKPRYSQSGDKMIYSEFLQKEMWPFGFVTVQEITYGTVSYVAGYVHKKLFDSEPIIHKEVDFYNSRGQAFHMIVPVKYDMYEYLGVQKPFSLMSKGLGKEWIEASKDLVYLTDEVIFYSGKFGATSCKPPRYYDKILALHNEEKANQIKERRKELAQSKDIIDSDLKHFYNMNVKKSQIMAKRRLMKRNVASLT